MSNFDVVSKMVEEQRAESIEQLINNARALGNNLYTEEDRPDTLNDFGYRIANAQVIGFLQAKLTMAMNEIDTLKEIYNEQA